jgi:tRNA-splicing ligase RtcB
MLGKHNKHLHSALRRIDDTRVSIENPCGVPVTLFASREVHIESEAVEQLLGFVSLQSTLSEIATAERAGQIEPFLGEANAALQRVVVTPDFHRGSGIPVGTVAEARHFVVPQAVGNDVCCGMRLLVTDVTQDELAPHLDALPAPLRHTFFRGGRDLPMSPRQREALLREGLWGLHETATDNAQKGLWQLYDPQQQENDLARVHFQGVLPAKQLFAFDDYVEGSGRSDGRDTQIGSVGGGNHFVELQVVEDAFSTAAHDWGLKRGAVTIMAHSGSVGLGHAVGGFFNDKARAIFPARLPRPEHGFWPLPALGPHAALAARYLDAMRNAANFAFGNRLFLGLMATRVLSDVLGRRVSARLVYDAPHNLIWDEERGPGLYLHRKGACPALGPAPDTTGPFRYSGHPVIIPGSMGASSYVLSGAGLDGALSSACHGAGRSLSRGDSRRYDEDRAAEALGKLRVVTPVDPKSAEVRLRRDVMAEYEGRLKEEAPYAYKDITPVINTVEAAGVANKVARLWPLLTIKG